MKSGKLFHVVASSHSPTHVRVTGIAWYNDSMVKNSHLLSRMKAYPFPMRHLHTQAAAP